MDMEVGGEERRHPEGAGRATSRGVPVTPKSWMRPGRGQTRPWSLRQARSFDGQAPDRRAVSECAALGCGSLSQRRWDPSPGTHLALGSGVQQRTRGLPAGGRWDRRVARVTECCGDRSDGTQQGPRPCLGGQQGRPRAAAVIGTRSTRGNVPGSAEGWREPPRRGGTRGGPEAGGNVPTVRSRGPSTGRERGPRGADCSPGPGRVGRSG